MRRLLLCLMVVGMVWANEAHYFIYTAGRLKYNNEGERKIFGDMTVEWRDGTNFVLAEGMYEGSKHIPFNLVFDIKNFTKNGDKITVTGVCSKGGWDSESRPSLTGTFSVTGTWEQATLKGECLDPETKDRFVIGLDATRYACNIFKPEDAGARASYLLGEPRERYLPVHVLNYAILGYPYFDVLKNCKYYLNSFGNVTTEYKPGYIVVASDGLHCGILDKEGDKFIHSNPVKKAVTIHPVSMIKEFFPQGFVLKAYTPVPPFLRLVEISS